MSGTTLIGIYLIGAVLAYFRVFTSSYDIDARFVKVLFPDRRAAILFGICAAVTSWIGFIAGVITYYIDGEKYFFKFSYNKLLKEYEKLHSE